jgi:hypothetical protein
MRPLRLLLSILGLSAALLGARAAHAYPQWQFSSGTARCQQCHYSPTGGGLINGYGRDAAGSDLSTWEGNGDFAHGAVDLPRWLALGADLRGAALAHSNGSPEGREIALFPMQADLLARFAIGDQFAVQVSAGYAGRVRSAGASPGAGGYEPKATSQFISREHYVIWRPAAQGAYVRAGRFFTPYGLRLAEHSLYVRRDMGINLQQETYGVSGGYLARDWELHLTAFGPDFLQNGYQEAGGGAMYERRFDHSALGLSTRVGVHDGATRTYGGPFAKYWAETIKTLLQVELNVLYEAAGGGNQTGFVGVLAPAVFPFKGLWVMPFVERRQTNLNTQDSATNAYGGQINWFPYPHFELTLLGRFQDPVGEAKASTAMAFLHYYL